MSEIITQSVLIIILLIVDIVFIIKPKIGILNLILGFFTIILTVQNLNGFGFSIGFNNYFIPLVVFVSLICMARGIELYSKGRKK